MKLVKDFVKNDEKIIIEDKGEEYFIDLETSLEGDFKKMIGKDEPNAIKYMKGVIINKIDAQTPYLVYNIFRIIQLANDAITMESVYKGKLTRFAKGIRKIYKGIEDNNLKELFGRFFQFYLNKCNFNDN